MASGPIYILLMLRFIIAIISTIAWPQRVEENGLVDRLVIVR